MSLEQDLEILLLQENSFKLPKFESKISNEDINVNDHRMLEVMENSW
jgi:hypothetical protein